MSEDYKERDESVRKAMKSVRDGLIKLNSMQRQGLEMILGIVWMDGNSAALKEHIDSLQESTDE